MFTIYGGNTEFNQWDLEQRAVEPSLVAGDKVVFLNSSGMTYPMKAYRYDNDIVVDVPNELLTMAMPIVVYINGRYDTRTIISVTAKTKPEGYIFVDNSDWPSDGCDDAPVEIKLIDCGIDLPTLITGERTNISVEDTGELWEKINQRKNVVFICKLGSEVFKVIPTVYKDYKGITTAVGLGVQLMYGAQMIQSAISLLHNTDGSTSIHWRTTLS